MSTPSSPRPFSPAFAHRALHLPSRRMVSPTVDDRRDDSSSSRSSSSSRRVASTDARADAQKIARQNLSISSSARRALRLRPSSPRRRLTSIASFESEKSTRRYRRRSIDVSPSIDRSVRTARSTKSRDRGAGMRRPTGPWRQAPRGKGANERRVASRDGGDRG